MRKILIASAAVVLGFAAAPAFAGGAGGGPVSDPGDPGDPGDGGNLGDSGTGTGTGNTGSGGGGSATPTTPSMKVGTGASVFNLDSLAAGTYQPYQDNSGLGVMNLPSAQTGLNQTSSGLTLSLRTADWYDTGAAPQTRIAVENMSSNFGYLGAPPANQQTVQAVAYTGSPTALFANFSNAVSYFSVEGIRLFGPFAYNVTFSAYSGTNGTGTLLGTLTGTVGSAATTNYASSLFEMTGLSGARSIAMLGSSGSLRFDNVTATAAPVPEPGEWAMMAAGLGIVGGLARRRKARNA